MNRAGGVAHGQRPSRNDPPRTETPGNAPPPAATEDRPKPRRRNHRRRRRAPNIGLEQYEQNLLGFFRLAKIKRKNLEGITGAMMLFNWTTYRVLDMADIGRPEQQEEANPEPPEELKNYAPIDPDWKVPAPKKPL